MIITRVIPTYRLFNYNNYVVYKCNPTIKVDGHVNKRDGNMDLVERAECSIL